jgi:hypothetical protein
MSDLTWKISKTALGHELNPRNCKVKKPIDKVFMKKMLEILKNTEWQSCPLYRVYKKHGRWKHESERIYREVEIQWLLKVLKGMENVDINKEFNECPEGK